MPEQLTNRKPNRIPWVDLRLPPFPEVAMKVMRLLEDEDAPISSIAKLILSDQAFSAEVLIVANSCLYAPRQPITSISQAAIALGQGRLQGLCVTVGVRTFLGRRLRDSTVKQIWHHSLATAIVAEQLALAGSGVDSDMAYTAGILHDVGRMGLVALQPKEYPALLKRHIGTPSSILPREWDLCGFDHCQLGRKLAMQWNLPSEFSSTAEEHHELRLATDRWTLVELAKMSCSFANASGYAAFSGCQSDQFDHLLTQLPEPERKNFHAGPESLAAEIENRIAALTLA